MPEIFNGLISIIIVNHNGRKWLKDCFDSLLSQDYQNFEIIFVDNNSSDDSLNFLESNYSQNKIKIIRNNNNSGFSGGNNLGYKVSRGEYVLLLNNDTRLEKDFLGKLVSAFSRIPNLGSVQPKMVLLNKPDKLDVCGSFWSDSTFLYHYGCYKDKTLPEYNRSFPVFTNKGACVLIKREVIEAVGLFDDDFWCYYEETDFCQRAWLAGYECWYYPETVCYHANGGTSINFNNAVIQFHNYKNKLLSFLKNFESRSLVKILPVYFILNFSLSLVLFLQLKFSSSWAIYRAIGWNIRNLKPTLKKRKLVRSFRIKSDKEIFKLVKKNPRLPYYFHLFGDLGRYKDVIKF